MPAIHPQVTSMDIMCAETPGSPRVMVIFGASGDLVHRKLLPSLAQIRERDLLNDRFCLIGCGRSQISDEAFRSKARESIQQGETSLSEADLEALVSKFYFVSGDYGSPDLYTALREKITALDEQYRCDRRILFYLSVPPQLYGPIAEQIGQAGLSHHHPGQIAWDSQLVVEKPFGRDLRSAQELNRTISQVFHESRIYRIDHYLGKETIQNILMFRFANAIFEPVWNRNYIDHIQLTIAETVGVEHRGGYYDQSGALRDMFQNHLLQMLALVAMEPPASFEADRIRDEKLKLLRSIRPPGDDALDGFALRAQYGPGTLAGQSVPGYLGESGVDPNSTTETFTAAKLCIHNWRWKDVPFYVRTGKRLAAKKTEIAIVFKEVPYSLFASMGLDEIPRNVLVMKIQPEEGIALSFQAKRPGSKVCMGTLNMEFSYENVFGVKMPEAYARLLLDCMQGDQTLFMRFDTLETTWQLLDPLLQAWGQSDEKLITYPVGCNSFPEADALIEADGHDRHWRPIG